MIAPEPPEDEPYRLDALRALDLLDTPPGPEFEAVVRQGQRLFGVPTCLVTLIDAERQWFKARAGMPVAETPRSISFCGHAILEDRAMVVLDATLDPRFADNPLVIGPPHIRFYAGAPIELPSGYRIGTVCVIAPEPRASFTQAEVADLTGLATLALAAVTVQGLRGEIDHARAELRRTRAALAALPMPVAVVDPAGAIETCNDAFACLTGRDSPIGLALGAVLPVADADLRGTAREIVLPMDRGRGTLRLLREADGIVALVEPDR